MRSRSVAVVVGAMVLALSVFSGCALSHAEAAAAPRLTIATYNVQTASADGRAWKPRRAKVLKLLKQTKADVVVLQETEAFGREAWKFPAGWLASKAGFVVAPTKTPVTYDSPDGYALMYSGPHILYRPGRLKFEKDSFTYGDDYRVRTPKSDRATFTDRRSNKRFIVVGLHLDHTNETSRRTQIGGALADLQYGYSHGLQRAPIIWAGDLNTTTAPRTPVRRFLTAQGVVDSVRTAKVRTNHRVNTFNGLRRNTAASGRRIDQIWVPSTAKVHRWTQVVTMKNGRYVGRFASDHNPIAATITLR